MSGASERANGRASGSVLQSVFLVILAHSAVMASYQVLLYPHLSVFFVLSFSKASMTCHSYEDLDASLYLDEGVSLSVLPSVHMYILPLPQI